MRKSGLRAKNVVFTRNVNKIKEKAEQFCSALFLIFLQTFQRTLIQQAGLPNMIFTKFVNIKQCLRIYEILVSR